MQKLLRMLHKNEEGFTLVELMVVVVIIGILVAVAFVVFGDIIEEAEVTANEANLRSIDGAIMMYRAGEGTYPDNIDALIDEYLDANPECPGCDEDEVYEIDGSGSDSRANHPGGCTSGCQFE